MTRILTGLGGPGPKLHLATVIDLYTRLLIYRVRRSKWPPRSPCPSRV